MASDVAPVVARRPRADGESALDKPKDEIGKVQPHSRLDVLDDLRREAVDTHARLVVDSRLLDVISEAGGITFVPEPEHTERDLDLPALCGDRRDGIIAAVIFEQMSTQAEFAEFLTLPLYEEIE